MKNFFYSMEIAEQIRSLLDSALPSTFKNITIGDLNLLPAPDMIMDYVPAVLINPMETQCSMVNENLQVAYDVYPFNIVYIYPFSFQTPEQVSAQYKNAELIANVFRDADKPNLNSLTIPKSETEAGGMVVQVIVNTIHFVNGMSQLFAELSVPACVVEIQVSVAFRTFYK